MGDSNQDLDSSVCLSDEFNYKPELSRALQDQNVSPQEVCLSGSVSFAVRGIRDNRDIDIITDGETLKARNLPNSCEITNDAFEIIGISDDEILENSRYHDIVGEFKIIRPELVFSYKKYYEREKDIKDLGLLEDYAFENPDDWKWDLVTYQGDWRFGATGHGSFSNKLISSLRRKGILETAVNGYERFIRDKIIDYYNFLYFLYSAYSLREQLTINIPVNELLARQYRFQSLKESELLSEYIAFHVLYNQKYPEWEREDFVSQIIQSEGLEFDINQLSIPISRTGHVNDPTQFAAALFLGLDEVEVVIQSDSSNTRLADVVQRQGLSSQLPHDQVRQSLLRSYGLIFNAILWPAVEAHFEEIEDTIDGKSFATILQSKDINFQDSNDFGDFIWEIYEPAQNPDWSTKKKIHKLQDYQNQIRVLEIEFIEKVLGGDVENTVVSLKNELREKYRETFDEYYHDIVIHMGDSFEENRYILRTINKFRDVRDNFGNQNTNQPVVE